MCFQLENQKLKHSVLILSWALTMTTVEYIAHIFCLFFHFSSFSALFIVMNMSKASASVDGYVCWKEQRDADSANPWR